MPFTPGPWVVSEAWGETLIYADRFLIADCSAFEVSRRETTRHERAHNARLISAAPDLLAAAKYMRGIQANADKWGSEIPEDVWRDGEEQLDAAIAKAESRQ